MTRSLFRTTFLAASIVLGIVLGCAVSQRIRSPEPKPGDVTPVVAPDDRGATAVPSAGDAPHPTEPTPRAVGILLAVPDAVDARPLAPLVAKAITWLVEAQHEDGGWGAGSHSNQGERNPHAVVTDPATTVFAAMALLRAGHSPSCGEYGEAVKRALDYMLRVVETCPEDGPRITALTGTQPQSKLGQLVDTSMAVQFFSRIVGSLATADDLRTRTDAALDKCLRKLQRSQASDGSWGQGGWAPVLQSSFGCSALELALAAGKQVDGDALHRARNYQKQNFDSATGRVEASGGAGVALYAFAGAQRGNAAEARAAQEILAEAKSLGKLEADAGVNEDNLKAAGLADDKAKELAAASAQAEAQVRGLNDESLLRGFGNNGGEEYLSYMLTSESLVIQGGKDWDDWNRKIAERLAKIQSLDGSWTGHHCITSPAFCTAAVIQCLTADRDAALLRRISDKEVAASRK